MKHLVALIPGLLVLLAGCGGGGSGGVREGAASSELPIPIEAAQRFGGLSAPTFTAMQIEAADDAILARANTLVHSDDIFVNGNA